MRILIVTQYFWPESFRITDLALELKKRGHEVVVLTSIPNYPGGKIFTGYNFFGPRSEYYQGIIIFRVPQIPRGQKKTWQLFLNYISFALSAIILGPLYCQGKFDNIFVAQYSPVIVGIPGIILKKIKKAPLFFWVQDLWPESLSATGAVHSKFVLNTVGSLVRFIYKHCDYILAQSVGFIERVKAMGGESKKIHYFPNWAEELYKPTLAIEDAPDSPKLPKGFRVMFAGNIGAAQDFETILTAAEKLKEHQDIHFVILGDGRARNWVENEVKKRGIGQSVHLLGRYPMEQMPRYFALADVMLVTLKNEPIFALTIPGKIQSYMACAKPIVAALDGEGARVITESGAGLAVPAEDPTALANAILKLSLMSQDERVALGRRAIAYYETHFNRAKLIDQFEKLMSK